MSCSLVWELLWYSSFLLLYILVVYLGNINNDLIIRNEEKKNRHKELYPDELDLREVQSTCGPNGHVLALIGWVVCVCGGGLVLYLQTTHPSLRPCLSAQ